jgi:hypothetical protein
MTEREFIKNIINRLQRKIYYEDSNTIEFDGDSYESVVIEFDENGLVAAIY